jgi:signal transduction histidine kinase/DNA-binding response OmpR family regulator
MLGDSKISTRLKVLLLLMVFIATAASIALFLSQRSQNNYLVKISLSSRQKAIAEELGRKMYSIHRQTKMNEGNSATTDDFRLTLNKWENAQKALLTGSEHYGTNGNNSNASQAMLQQSSGHFVQGRDFMTAFIGNPTGYEIPQLDSGMVLLDNYISSINNVTGQFLAESEMQSKLTTSAVIVISTCSLFLLLFGLIAVIKPMKLTFEALHSEIEAAEEKVKEALSAKAEFLSNMSHEVRTPLNGVIGMSEILLQSKLDEEQRACTRNIHNSAFHLLDLLNNVLDVAKLQSGKMEIRKERFNLSDCIDQVIDMLKPLAHGKKIELMSDLSSNVPLELISDEHRVRQILMNLVNNAIKFTEKGEVVIRTELVNIENGFVQIEFSVSDTGIGIEPDKLEKIFESFYQVDSSFQKKYGGSGLGLAISQSLANELGSKIKVQSNPGRGSCFSFNLVAEVSGIEHREKVNALRGMQALIVDDNTTNLKILVKQLSGWGIQVTPFNSPQLVTDVMSSLNKFDFVILDMQMPEMDGHSVAKSIRAHFTIQELPIIVLSSIGEYAMTDNDNLYNAYLTKPVKQSKLLDTIIDVMKISPSQRAKLTMQSGNVDILAAKSPLKILLAQDNELSRAVNAKTLELLGHKYITVTTGREVIEKSRREDYDLILMDVKDNEMDGIETTKQLKRLVNQESMPVIIGLTNDEKRDKASCIQAGMDDTLAKPMTAETLRQKINYWIIQE